MSWLHDYGDDADTALLLGLHHQVTEDFPEDHRHHLSQEVHIQDNNTAMTMVEDITAHLLGALQHSLFDLGLTCLFVGTTHSDSIPVCYPCSNTDFII